MAQSGQRKCLCCGEFFDLDHRNRDRQKFCSAPACRRASKASSQAAWLTKPHNAAYFRDPVHVARVQAWRVRYRHSRLTTIGRFLNQISHLRNQGIL